ncbi:hypothetical protein ACFQ0X_21970 [Streptomyces rectiviolaceus]|uniref:Uncharacterized protein n=1 Tax=Streptomyces rectiviolaceus TaxID=332591 RepID=A0ABP6M6Q9_9ACTN
MSDASIPQPRTEPSPAYWLDSPVLERKGLRFYALDDDEPPRHPGGTFRYLMIGVACALIVAALALTVSA